MRHLWAVLMAIAMLTSPAQTAAQMIQPVLVIDIQVLVSQSKRGQTLIADKAALNTSFQQEGAAIAAALEEEERSLTELRDQMDDAEFLTLAEAFDRKVVRLRQENQAKSQSLNTEIAKLDSAFQAELGPIVAEIMRVRGAGVVLQKRQVFVNGRSVDITEEVIRRMDMGAGLE